MAGSSLGRYQAIFREAAFRWFWLGFTGSALGDTMTRVALTWFVYQATGSAAALGGLLVAYSGPIIVGGLVAGWLLDRYDRRQVMFVDSVVRGIAVSAIPLLFIVGRLQVWHVYVVAAVYGSLMMISLAGGPALVPSLVRREQLATANALESLGFTVSSIVGPLVAGLLIARFGVALVVTIDAASYFFFALALRHVWRLVPGKPRGPGSASAGLREAFQLLRGNPILQTTTLMYMGFNFGGGLLYVGLPILASTRLAGGAELYGVLLGALGAGQLIGAIAAGAVDVSLPLGLLICLTQFLSGVALLLLPLEASSAVLVGLSLAFYGLFSAPLTVWAQTLRMSIIPEHVRGRTFALLRTLMQGTGPVGGAAAGFILPIVGLLPLLALSGILTGVPGLVGSSVDKLRQARDQISGRGDHAPPPTADASTP